MPIYEYECLKCKKFFEVLQKINSEPLSECISCKGPVKKLISPSSFQFKGSGWYITDYKNKKNKEIEQTNLKNKSDKDKAKDKNVTPK